MKGNRYMKEDDYFFNVFAPYLVDFLLFANIGLHIAL